MTGLPSRTASVMTATTDVVISLKSKTALRRLDFRATAVSRMSVMRMQESVSLGRPIWDAFIWRYSARMPVASTKPRQRAVSLEPIGELRRRHRRRLICSQRGKA